MYELVSPPYKGGYGAQGIDGVSANGESVVFESLGAFAGDPASTGGQNLYLARRGEKEWSTSPLMVPAALAPLGVEPIWFSPDLESVLWYAVPGPNHGAAILGSHEQEFLSYQTGLPDTAGDWEVQAESWKASTKKVPAQRPPSRV